MSDSSDKNTYQTQIWDEQAHAGERFAAERASCAGYDVFGELIHKASWVDYLYLMYFGDRPSPEQSHLLERLAVVLAHPGLRDAGVLAAMNAGVGKSTTASCLVSALSIGAGQIDGGQALRACVEHWVAAGCDLDGWRQVWQKKDEPVLQDTWPKTDVWPGLEVTCGHRRLPVNQVLNCLASVSCGVHLQWLQNQVDELERLFAQPIGMVFVFAAAFRDLGCEGAKAEMLYLLLRLPGAGAQALEQMPVGWRNFPLYDDCLQLEEVDSGH